MSMVKIFNYCGTSSITGMYSMVRNLLSNFIITCRFLSMCLSLR